MANFDILVNGAPAPTTIFVVGDGHTTQQITLAAKDGTHSAGKLVTIAPSCLTYISTLSGNLDANGHFTFVIGPSFAAKGTVTLLISVGGKNNSQDVTFS